MEATKITVQGRLIGASKLKDYTTRLENGQTGLTIGSRNNDGRFTQTNIKVDKVNITDFEDLFDEKIEIVLENVSINSYMSGNRAALSVKAKSAFIELA